MMKLNGLDERNIHFKWSPSLKPVLYVDDEQELIVKIPDSSTLQINRNSSTDDMSRIDSSKLDAAVGPIYVNGAAPGDVLEVKIMDLSVADWGWTGIIKNFGFLKGMFENRLVIWDIKDGIASTSGDFLGGVNIQISPFLGIIGVAPSEGDHPMIPPQSFGGNMDNKLLKKGASVFLPVYREGAMLSLADPHAAQGDGEVCGTAIESIAEAKIFIKVHKNMRIKYPRAFSSEEHSGEVIVAMGIHCDLLTAAKESILNMIEELKLYGFSADESYMLCSVAGNLRISEIVDEPNFVVSTVLAKEIAMSRKWRSQV
ncbi:MAG: acetamidase/formamidase family protein [Candidatus Thermoplasmatota archaeon]|nr:acetamidase/formamidase family protein [Candidatus Thermoplasmatota archaeon]